MDLSEQAMYRRLAAMAVATVAAGGVHAPAAGQSEPPFQRVRAIDARAERLLLGAWRASETVRALVETLEASDLVVHVESQLFRSEYRGHVHLTNAAQGYRYVRVLVKLPGLPHRVFPALAHELQHAVEIAQAPEVRDEEALANLLKRIGWRVQDETAFETEAALAIEKRVRREVMRPSR